MLLPVKRQAGVTTNYSMHLFGSRAEKGDTLCQIKIKQDQTDRVRQQAKAREVVRISARQLQNRITRCLAC